jgi:hypothetical protein
MLLAVLMGLRQAGMSGRESLAIDMIVLSICARSIFGLRI